MFVNVISSFLMSSDLYMPVSSKGYKLACAPFEDSDQPAYPRSLISVFAMRSMCSRVFHFLDFFSDHLYN